VRKVLISIFLFNALFGMSQSDTSDSAIPATAVEVFPEYPGGEGAMMKYIANNLELPKDDIYEYNGGKIHVRFTINTQGKVVDIIILNSTHFSENVKEAIIDVFEKMPDWKPGILNGTAVPVFINLPIRICLF
jgi:protein TonB